MSDAKKLETLKTENEVDVADKWSDRVRVIELGVDDHSSCVDPEKCIVICDHQDPDFLLQLAIEKGFTQIVQKSTVDFQAELNASALILNELDTFIKYPLSSILKPTKAGVVTEKRLCFADIQFKQASEKVELLKEIEVQLGMITKSRMLVAEVLGVADELITNAIFNAPFINSENYKSGVSRRESGAGMAEGRSGRISIGSDGLRIVVACHDPYGSLQLKPLLEKVRNCYKTGVAENIDMGEGGAGIGSFMIYNSCSSYYAAVKTGKETLIACAIPLNMSARKRVIVPKNLHYFNIQE